jgi:glycosyltransferase involved in cell wall biosynthesis
LHAERGFIFYVLAARLLGIKHIVRTVHNNFNFGGWLRIRRGLERRLAAKLGVRYIAIAPGVEQTERTLYGVSPQLIPNWFDSEHFQLLSSPQRNAARARLGLKDDEFTIVSIGNCSTVKNHAALIEALAQQGDLSWRYLHVGLEESGAPERALAERLGIAEKIQFIGPVSDVRPFLHAADLYVMPSLYEGLGIATLEAFAIGLPALLAEVPGLVDFRHYLNELSYCPPDTLSLAAALRSKLAVGIGSDCDSVARSVAIHEAFGAKRGVLAYSTLYAQMMSDTNRATTA